MDSVAECMHSAAESSRSTAAASRSAAECMHSAGESSRSPEECSVAAGEPSRSAGECMHSAAESFVAATEWLDAAGESLVAPEESLAATSEWLVTAGEPVVAAAAGREGVAARGGFGMIRGFYDQIRECQPLATSLTPPSSTRRCSLPPPSGSSRGGRWCCRLRSSATWCRSSCACSGPRRHGQSGKFPDESVQSQQGTLPWPENTSPRELSSRSSSAADNVGRDPERGSFPLARTLVTRRKRCDE
jgi:hypothetical protein